MNETNAVTIPHLNKILEVNNALLGLPALPLVFIGCIAMGYLLSSIPIYKNRWIPAGVFLTGIVLNLLITPLTNVPGGVRAVILGLIAGGLAWIAHAKFMTKWIDASAFKNGDTERETKKPETP